MAKVLFIIAKDGFRDEELFETREVLESKGHDCVVASSEAGECKGSKGGSASASISLKAARDQLSSFDAVVFVGGPGAKAFQNDNDALTIAKDHFASGKLTSAICIAPTVLAVAGILKGKKATVWNEDNSQSPFIEERGAHYTSEAVTVDGNIITADGPQSARAFGEAIAKHLEQAYIFDIST